MSIAINGYSQMNSYDLLASPGGETWERDVGSGSTLSSAPGGGDPITEVAILLAQSYREERKQARSLSDAAEGARFRDAEQQVQEMREKASSIRSEGWVKGLSQVVSGGAGLAGGITSFSMSEGKAQSNMAIFSGAGEGVEGLGTIAGKGYAADAEIHQSNADSHASQAAAHKAASEKYRDEADEARRMGNKVLDFLQKVNETRASSEGIAASMRG